MDGRGWETGNPDLRRVGQSSIPEKEKKGSRAKTRITKNWYGLVRSIKPKDLFHSFREPGGKDQLFGVRLAPVDSQVTCRRSPSSSNLRSEDGCSRSIYIPCRRLLKKSHVSSPRFASPGTQRVPRSLIIAGRAEIQPVKTSRSLSLYKAVSLHPRPWSISLYDRDGRLSRGEFTFNGGHLG